MVKRYNFFFLLLSLAVNFQLILKHVEFHSVPTLYTDTILVPVYNNHTLGESTNCSNIYKCFYQTCIYNKRGINTVQLTYNFSHNLTCDDSWRDILTTLEEEGLIMAIVIILFTILFLLSLIVVLVIIAYIRFSLGYDEYSSLISSLRGVIRKHWAIPYINMLLFISHVLNLVVCVLVVINTYLDMLPHLVYSTLIVEAAIVMLQLVYIIDNRKLNMVSEI